MVYKLYLDTPVKIFLKRNLSKKQYTSVTSLKDHFGTSVGNESEG